MNKHDMRLKGSYICTLYYLYLYSLNFIFIFVELICILLFDREEKFPDLEADFKPTLINTVVYIISMGMQISTFAINYKVSFQYDNK